MLHSFETAIEFFCHVAHIFLTKFTYRKPVTALSSTHIYEYVGGGGG
jgi:hypothetical protein